MTLRAIVAEVACHVIGVCRALEVGGVTLIAIRILQLIVPICVARLTLDGDMCSSQRELGCIMVERRSSPIRC